MWRQKFCLEGASGKAPPQVCVESLGGRQRQGRARPGFPMSSQKRPGGKVSSVLIKLLLTGGQIPPCTLRSSTLNGVSTEARGSAVTSALWNKVERTSRGALQESLLFHGPAWVQDVSVGLKRTRSNTLPAMSTSRRVTLNAPVLVL